MHRSVLSRRSFLHRAGLAGAGLALGAALPAPLRASVCDAPTAAAFPTPITETRVLMGTFVRISVANAPADRAEEGLGRVFELARRLELVFNRHDAASPLAVLNDQGSLPDAPPELCDLMVRALRYGDLTSGAFDMTVTPVLELFRSRRTSSDSLHVSPAELREVLALVDAHSVRIEGSHIRLLRKGMRVTLDGIAKGHVADALSGRLRALGLENHLIDAGGDIVAHGEKAPGVPWTVAVEDPAKRGAYPALLHPRDVSVATSGGYEMFYDAAREHHHLIDPATGTSPAWVGGVTVTAATAMEADALATALSVLPPQEALRRIRSLPERECCIIDRYGLRYTSPGWG